MTVKIGWSGDLTGALASGEGEPQLHSAQIAIAYLKQTGQTAPGVTYSLEMPDTAVSPGTAAANARDFHRLGRHRHLRRGPSEESIAMQGAVNRGKVLYFTSNFSGSLATDVGEGKQYPWVTSR